MTDDMQEFVAEAKKSKFHTIPKLTEDDVVSVWENVASFVERHMSMQKGVQIPGLGIFTFSQKKLDIGNNKFVLMQRPVFVVSEKFAQVHNLQYTKYFTSGQIPIIQLNYAVLSNESPFDRDTVAGCVKEIILSMSRAVQAGRNIEFTFVGIGKLSIRDGKVKMKFFKDFINMMDGSGQLVDALRNRPDTTDSVISRSSVMSVRPGTSNTFVLPRITQNLGKDGLVLEQESAQQAPMSPIAEVVEIEPADERIEEEPEEEVDDGFDEDGEDPSKKSHPPSWSASRQVVPTAKAVGISLTDDLFPSSPPPKGIKGSGITPSPPSSPKGELPPPRTELKPPRPPHIATPNRRSMTPPDSSCGHGAGQELCYLCHQRAANNIPVSFDVERKKKEQEQDRLLQQYQHMKDTQAIIHEQAQNFHNRHHSQKIAAFNLGVSEAMKTKQKERPTKFHSSYIFQTTRPLTPPRQFLQDEYATYLAEQVEAKTATKSKNKHDQDFLERLEQVQLAEELAAQREQFLRDKAAQTDMYQRALSAQVKIREMISRANEEDQHMESVIPCANPHAGCELGNRLSSPRIVRHLDPLTLPVPKIILPFSESEPVRLKMPDKRMVRFKPLPLPAAVPDSKEPIFGKYDATNELLADKRRRAIKVYHEQLAAEDQDKKMKLLRHLKTQREETDMLDRTRRELMADRAARFDDMFSTRKSLEQSWRDAAESKRRKESVHQLKMQSPGLLLHEQCEKYHRCDQCQRRLANCGESNIWSDSRYIPGSRLVV